MVITRLRCQISIAFAILTSVEGGLALELLNILKLCKNRKNITYTAIIICRSFIVRFYMYVTNSRLAAYLSLATLLYLFIVILLLIPNHTGTLSFGNIIISEVWAQSENSDRLVDREQAEEISEEGEGKIDKVHKRMSRRILATANWLDSFFGDELFEAEENRSRVRVRLDSFTEDGEDTDLDVNFNLKIALPQAENRLYLVIAGDEDDDLTVDDTLDNVIEGKAEDSDLTTSFMYFFKSTVQENISMRVHFLFRDDRFVSILEPRYRYLMNIDPWSVRFTQRARYHTDKGWDERTSIDFERQLQNKYFFRTTLQGEWFEEKDGFFYALGFSLFHPLDIDRALQYEWINAFQTKPSNNMDVSIFKIRYRQRFWRDWLFFEVTPQISIPRERDYELVSGILFRLEAYLGKYKRFNKHPSSPDRDSD